LAPAPHSPPNALLGDSGAGKQPDGFLIGVVAAGNIAFHYRGVTLWSGPITDPLETRLSPRRATAGSGSRLGGSPGAVNEISVSQGGAIASPPHFSTGEGYVLAPGDWITVKTPGGGGRPGGPTRP